MAFSRIQLLPTFLLLLALAANKVVSQTSFIYDTFSPTSKNLIYQGDALVPASSSFVSLTKVNASGYPLQQSVGRVVYSPPVKFWDTNLQTSFETTIKFSIIPVNNSPGDGLTFFIIPVGSPIPNSSAGGNLGLFNPKTGLAPSVFAVEFDIFYSGDNTWDPNYPHIGIDINSRASKANSKYEGSLGEVVTARINYEHNTRRITVVANFGNKYVSLSYDFDLKTILPKEVQVGVSASTGGSVALHDLHAWYFSSTGLTWDSSLNAIA